MVALRLTPCLIRSYLDNLRRAAHGQSSVDLDHTPWPQSKAQDETLANLGTGAAGLDAASTVEPDAPSFFLRNRPNKRRRFRQYRLKVGLALLTTM